MDVLQDMDGNYIESHTAKPDFGHFWRQFNNYSLRDKRIALLGVARFYLRLNQFDSREPIVVEKNVKIEKNRYGKIYAGRGVRLADGCTLIVGTGRSEGIISLGARTTVGPGTRISAATKVSIGDRCMISWYCSIFDSTGHPVWLGTTGETLIEEPITIGDDVLIGPQSIIMKGVTIGNNCVIGAGSVVRRDVPPNSLVYGNPARVAGTVDTWQR